MKNVFKISKKFYASCTKIEQEYLLERATVDGVAYCKEVIKAARKQFGDKIDNMLGCGYVMVGEYLWQYSGSDTKQWKKIGKGNIK